MLFNSFQYWIFFLIVANAVFTASRFASVSSYSWARVTFFYMWWDPRFIVLILTSTVVDYYLGILLETASGRRKKFLLVLAS